MTTEIVKSPADRIRDKIHELGGHCLWWTSVNEHVRPMIEVYCYSIKGTIFLLQVFKSLHGDSSNGYELYGPVNPTNKIQDDIEWLELAASAPEKS